MEQRQDDIDVIMADNDEHIREQGQQGTLDTGLSHDGTCFESLPIPLYNEIFKFLNLAERNKIRRVSSSWDRAIKFGFGVRVIIDNNNLRDVTTVEDVLEAQVRNLTLQIPKITTFRYASGIRFLDICGMILSKNFISFLTEFQNLIDLKLSRVYLETDLRLELTDEEKMALPQKIESIKMRFLKTIHKTPGSFELGRSTETFALTSSDTTILALLNEFQLPNLKNLELYHDMTDEVRGIRNSDMIERTRQGNIELANPATEAITRVLSKLFGYKKLKKLRLDNLPTLQTHLTNSSSTSTLNTIGFRERMDENLTNTQLTTLQLDGISVGEWSTLIRAQNQLKILDLVILNTNLLESVKLAVINSSSTLISLCLILANPSDMVIPPAQQQQDNNNENLELRPAPPPIHNRQNPNQNLILDNSFDLMFLFQCHHLTNLTIKYSPKKLDISFLPTSLKQLQLCGSLNTDGLLHFISLAFNLRRLIVDICDAPVSHDLPPEHPLTFNINLIKTVLKESHLDDLMVSEAGASEEFQNFVDLCTDRRDILVKMDAVNYKVTFAEGGFGRRMISVPRIHVQTSSAFDRINF